MGLRIGTNVASLQGQRNLTSSTKALNKALERLSSGQRIVKAGDDAAGLAISEGLRAQIRGFRQAIRNANDAMGFLSTAEGSLSEMTNVAQRLRELAIQAANGSLGSRDRQYLDGERSALVEEFNRIATSASFNATKLLDGSFSTVDLQVGVQKGERISFTIGDARATALGSLAVISGAQNRLTAEVSNLTIGGKSITANPSFDNVSVAGNAYSAITIARAINNESGSTGVSASIVETNIQLKNMTWTAVSYGGSLGAGDLVINGVEILGSATNSNSFINLINDFSNSTGVRARLAQGNSSQIELFASDGRNIRIAMNGGSAGFNQVFAFSSNRQNFSNNGANLLFASGAAGVSAAITGRVFSGAIELTSSDAIVIAGTSPSNALGFSGLVVNVDTSKALANIGISSQIGAQNALAVVDATLQQLTGLRANLGAVQNRLEAVVTNLSISTENLSSAQSEIRDADMAVEVAELTKNQILQQAGVAVLGQANASAQIALSLLQG
jgi:flagellin